MHKIKSYINIICYVITEFDKPKPSQGTFFCLIFLKIIDKFSKVREEHLLLATAFAFDIILPPFETSVEPNTDQKVRQNPD